MEKQEISTKKEFIELINKHLEKSIEQVARSQSYLATLINIENTDIGNVTVNKNYSYNQNYEVAAWHSSYEVKEGVYPAKANVKNGTVSVSFYPTARLTEEYTPSLFGGVPITSGKKELPDKDTTILQHFHSGNHSIEITNPFFKLEKIINRFNVEEYKVQINYDNPDIINIINKNRSFYENQLETNLNRTILHYAKNDDEKSLLRGIGDYKPIEGQQLYEIVQELTQPHLKRLKEIFNNNINQIIKENTSNFEFKNIQQEEVKASKTKGMKNK